jgi:hypothetical protein
VLQRYILLAYIVQLCYNARCKKNVNFIIKLRIIFERRPVKNDGTNETSGAYKGTAYSILHIEPDDNVQLAHLSLNMIIIVQRDWRLSIRLDSNYGLHKWSGFC